MKDVTPTSLLKDRVREVEGNPDFSNKDVASTQPQIVGEAKSGTVTLINQVELPLDVASPSHPSGHSRLPQVNICLFVLPSESFLLSHPFGVVNLFGGSSMLLLTIFLRLR